MYVACETSNAVYVVEAGTMKVLAQIPTGKRPRAIYLSRNAHRGYVSDEFGAALTEFSSEDYQVVKTIASRGSQSRAPMGLVSPADGRHLYVTTGGPESCSRSTRHRPDPPYHRTVGRAALGRRAQSDGHTAYTANGPSGDISIIDLKTGEARKPG